MMEKKRSNPPKIEIETHATALETIRSGILILNCEGELLYLNPSAKNLLNTIQGEHLSSGNSTASGSQKKERSVPLPPLIRRLYRYFKRLTKHDPRMTDHGTQFIYPISLKENLICHARAFRLQSASETAEGAPLLILIEALSPGRGSTVTSPHLTGREQAVVRFLFDGKTNKEVAISMGISEHTVKEHMKRIMKKLCVTNRAGIVAYFAHSRGPSGMTAPYPHSQR